MNFVHISKYAPDGTLLMHHKKHPPSHMNVDYYMREVAVQYGYVLVNKAITLSVTDRQRYVEWGDEKGNFYKVSHRLERAISHIEYRFYDDTMYIISRRGTRKEVIRRCNSASHWAKTHYALLRKYVEVGRLRFVPSVSNIGFVAIPILKGWDSE